MFLSDLLFSTVQQAEDVSQSQRRADDTSVELKKKRRQCGSCLLLFAFVAVVKRFTGCLSKTRVTLHGLTY